VSTQLPIIDKQMLVNLINNERACVQEICDLLFAEILILQEEIVHNKMHEFKSKLKLFPNDYVEFTEDEVLAGMLADVTADVKVIVKKIAASHVDSILDAKNERLITDTQMKTLLTIINGLTEAIELEL
jgi:hypothetical protein